MVKASGYNVHTPYWIGLNQQSGGMSNTEALVCVNADELW